MKSSHKVRLAVEDGAEVVTTAPSCGDCLSPQSELRLAAENGNVPAMYHYALECSEPEERKRWLRMAVEKGYFPAMCDYGLECDDPDERKRWLREAAHEGYVPAIYQYGLECDDPATRKYWLLTLAWLMIAFTGVVLRTQKRIA